MIKIEDKSKCSGCYACLSACPRQCIVMQMDEEGFLYPEVDQTECTACGLCEKICPVLHSEKQEESEILSAYAAVNKNEETRMQSSSGGIFTLLAEYILNQGGVVFGAAFAGDYKSVCHVVVKDTSELWKLRGAKYVQSSIGDCYVQAKEFLEAGRSVLFTGTPCQIEGLKAYLHRDYSNLYTQDLICHGVPSTVVWKEYVKFREKRAKNFVKKVEFRYKKYGWKRYSILFEFMNDGQYCKKCSQDRYMEGYLKNIYLRPSCYQCVFKKWNRKSDITLADFWKIEEIFPEMDDDKGTSLVFIHSEKGKYLWDAVKESTKYKQTDSRAVVKYNMAMLQSAEIPKERGEYIQAAKTHELDSVLNKYFYISFGLRIKRTIRYTLASVKRMVKMRRSKSVQK